MVEPNIIKTKYYTLVSADTGHGKTLWCKKKVARLLRTTQDRIIVIDVTGEYADFVLNHDRIVPGRIPMVMHQYKLSAYRVRCKPHDGDVAQRCACHQRCTARLHDRQREHDYLAVPEP